MMKERLKWALPGAATLAVTAMLGLPAAVSAATIKQITDAGEARAAAAQADQRRIDEANLLLSHSCALAMAIFATGGGFSF